MLHLCLECAGRADLGIACIVGRVGRADLGIV